MTIDNSQVRAKAIRYLSRREYCQKELTRKLVQRGAEHHQALEVVASLAETGAVCDARFAIEFVRVRVRQGYGPVRIEYELKERGVAESLAIECLKHNSINWSDLLNKVAKRKYQDRSIDNYKEWARRANFFKNRGFTSDQINEVLGKFGGIGNAS